MRRLAAVVAALILTVSLGAVTFSIGYAQSPVLIETETATVTSPPRTVEVTRTIRAARSAPRRTQVAQPTPRATQPATGSTNVYKTYARNLVPAAQWPCLDRLWTRESHWNPRAVGAVVDGVRVVGIPQLRGLKVTDGWQYQIRRGLSYIDHRYGTPCAAWAAFQDQGWY